VEEGGTMITLDHGEGATFFQERPELLQRTPGLYEMFQYKTYKDVIETGRFEREMENIPLPECHIGQALFQGHLLRPGQGVFGNIKGCDLCFRAVFCQDHCLGTDPAAGFKHPGAGRIVRIMMEEIRERLGLVREPLRFAG